VRKKRITLRDSELERSKEMQEEEHRELAEEETIEGECAERVRNRLWFGPKDISLGNATPEVIQHSR
jgi:hypothetical protein